MLSSAPTSQTASVYVLPFLNIKVPSASVPKHLTRTYMGRHYRADTKVQSHALATLTPVLIREGAG
jgi:hypothetical protein